MEEKQQLLLSSYHPLPCTGPILPSVVVGAGLGRVNNLAPGHNSGDGDEAAAAPHSTATIAALRCTTRYSQLMLMRSLLIDNNAQYYIAIDRDGADRYQNQANFLL